jgi:hypothetical protein
MARGHGRILSSIWDDEDFLRLPPGEQRLYLFLISQPNLNHAGLLPLTLRRWASKADGLTAADIQGQLRILDVTGFVVLDEDTEEILIRSFVRNDGVWKQPRVMGAMVSGAMEISSRRLRAALLLEIDRVPLDELSDAPGAKGAPSIRAQVSEHIALLRKAFGDLPPEPPRHRAGTPSRGGSATPSGTPSGTPSDTPAEGDAEGDYARARVGACPRVSPAPSPAPIPRPLPEGGAVGASVTARADDAYTAPIDEDGGFHLNDELRRWAHRDGYADLVDIDYATTQFVSHYRSTGQNRHNWPEAWRKWIREDHKRAAERASRSHLRALPSAGIDGLVSRQQQETDDWSARAMNRAINRMQQTGTDPLELPS